MKTQQLVQARRMDTMKMRVRRAGTPVAPSLQRTHVDIGITQAEALLSVAETLEEFLKLARKDGVKGP